MKDLSQPKMERLVNITGTATVVRVTCEVEADGTDTTSVSASFTVAGRVTTARLIATADRLLHGRAADVCLANDGPDVRQKMKSLADYVEAWYHEYTGPHLLKALNGFAESPAPAVGGGPCS